MIDRLQSFCRAHQCAGPADAASISATLGHVTDRRAFEGVLTSVRRPTSGLRRQGRSAGPWLTGILRQGLAVQQKDLAQVPLGTYLMWSFYDVGRPAEPFVQMGKQPAELVRRLGLGQIQRGTELLVWAHRLAPGQTVHVPTVLDAELNPAFQPGGKTRPLSGRGGMNEVVHSPVTGALLEEPITSVGKV